MVSLTIAEIAARLGKPLHRVPVWLLAAWLWLGRVLFITRYGPKQISYLRYRPVLANNALKETFGFTPAYTSAETFVLYRQHHPNLNQKR